MAGYVGFGDRAMSLREVTYGESEQAFEKVRKRDKRKKSLQGLRLADSE